MNKQDVLNYGWFNLARLQSLKTDFRAQVGAVAVRKGKVVALGRNWPYKTHPMMRKYDPYKTIHAECDLAIGTDRDLLVGATVFVYREWKDGTLANAKPCEVCTKILEDLCVKKVYYTTSEGYKEYKL